MKINLKTILGFVIIIIVSFVFFVRYKNSAKEKLIECLVLTGVEFKGTSESGYITGDAFIQLAENGNSCSVEYSLLNNSAFENGKLVNLKLEEKKSNNTYRIVGDWEAEGGSSIGAKFIFEVFDDVKPNTIACQISGARGSNWAHYSNLKLSNEKFMKIRKILSINKDDISSKSDSFNNENNNWEDFLKSKETVKP